MRKMTDRQKHKWIGWGYDSTICEHCRIDVYDELQIVLRTEYCDELPKTYSERSDLLNQIKEQKQQAKEAALNHARSVLSEEQWNLIGIAAPYRVKDYIL